MDNLLNEILKADSQAKERLEKAQDYRKELLLQLPEKKAEIEKEETCKAIDEVRKRSSSYKSAGDKKLEELKKSHIKAEQKMNELFEQKGSHWVEEIVNKTING